ncbi:MAG TPA: YggS family pyridoxal phosphate-dependent enzyme [Candidatus Limnocylindria bacterium]|nr:YggS family pyridoxal phosphate-dependent enzyme [Candidatus Limnocylindria bacterium]
MNDPSAEQIRRRHDALLDRLRAISEAGGHDPARLRIVAVTKAHPIAVARRAMEAGLTRLGESRVQEAEPKIAALPDIEWHFIGRIQSNKARRVIRSFAVIHSVDSVDLLRRLDRRAAEENRRSRVLLQVNVAAEASKAGLAPDGLTAIVAPTNLDLVGLMTIAPMGASEQEARAVFGRLRELRDRLQEAAGIGLPELSMGMSADAEAAAAEGATLVRIGTALFGHRH